MNETNGHNSDSSLMKNIAAGDQEALEILMDRYLPMVSRVSYRILCDIPESEVVSKEVFLKVWKGAGEYDFRHGVSLWMYRLICDLCYIHIRRMHFLDLLSIHPAVYETSAPQSATSLHVFLIMTGGVFSGSCKAGDLRIDFCTSPCLDVLRAARSYLTKSS